MTFFYYWEFLLQKTKIDTQRNYVFLNIYCRLLLWLFYIKLKLYFLNLYVNFNCYQKIFFYYDFQKGRKCKNGGQLDLMIVQHILELTEINGSCKIKETQIKEKTTEMWKAPRATHTEDYAIPYFFNSHRPGNRRL